MATIPDAWHPTPYAFFSPIEQNPCKSRYRGRGVNQMKKDVVSAAGNFKFNNLVEVQFLSWKWISFMINTQPNHNFPEVSKTKKFLSMKQDISRPIQSTP